MIFIFARLPFPILSSVILVPHSSAIPVWELILAE